MKKRMHFSKRGFALAGVLWILAGLSLLIALLADITQTAAERVALLRQRSDFIISALSAKAQAQYWLSTANTGLADFKNGDVTVHVDGTLYQPDKYSFIRLQDAGGLINLASVDRNLLERFLHLCGASLEDTTSLIDALEDYVDGDNLQRLHGAEQETYIAAGLQPPRNSPLLTSAEVWAVYGWKKYRKSFEDNGCANEMTILGETTMLGTSLNMATAPIRILEAAGLNKEQALDIIKAREDPERLAERTAYNNELAGRNTGTFGALSGKHAQRSLHITHQATQGPWLLSYTLVLDSSAQDSPWNTTQSEIRSAPHLDTLQVLPWGPGTPLAPATTTSNATTDLFLQP